MPAFHLLRSTRVEVLADALAARMLAVPPADVFAPVTVCVGSKGMERWLRHRLACTPLGISANIEFPFPAQALAGVFPGAEGADGAWSPDSLVWTVVAVLPEVLDRPELEPLRAWLRRDIGGLAAGISRDRYALAREVAEVLDRACLFRPEWIDAWESGRDPAAPAGARTHTAPPAAWQRVLWNAVRARLPTPPPAQRFAAATPTEGEDIHIFAVSSMPPRWLDAWRRAGKRRDIFYYLLTPSDVYWGDLRTRSEFRRAARQGGIDAAESQLALQNPILSSLGRLARDTGELLLDCDVAERDLPDAFIDPGDASVLATLQSDLLAVRSSAELRALAPDRVLRREDDSVRFHNCHGPTRQVEALRDALLACFEAHPHLQPRDVLVMTPNIAAHAPLIQAVFAEGGNDVGGPRIPAHIADLGLRTLNPLADALLRLIELVPGRLTASGFADLAGSGPVRQHFRLDEDDVARLRGWLADAGARWGADAAERGRHGNPPQHLFTFAFAFERLALGVAVPDAGGDSWRDIAPFDEMEGAAVATFGKIAELLARLEVWRRALAAPRPMAAWAAELGRALDDIAEVTSAAAFLRAEVEEGLEALAGAAEPFGEPVSLDVVASLLEGRFERGRGGDRPASGAVSVCALTPMRSVPFRVICLLGMDDGAFPRTPAGRGFDATLSAPRPGDRDPREEDRNLLLEALLSAREHLFVFFTGRDVHTDKSLAPAVPVGDLLDVIDTTFGSPFSDGRPPRDALTVRHAVQPFSASGFVPAEAWPSSPRPARFDRRMAAAASALSGPRSQPRALFPAGSSLPDPTPPTELTIEEFVRWLSKPVRTLLKSRAGLYLDDQDDSLSDREGLTIDKLEEWGLGKSVARGWLAGEQDMDAVLGRLTARAELPPGAPGRATFGDVWSKIAAAAAGLPELAPARPVTVRVALSHVTIVGSMLVHGGTLVDFAGDSPEKPRRLIDAWVRLLLLRASDSAADPASIVVGLVDKKPRTLRLKPPSDPVSDLDALARLCRAARTRPLPLIEKTSHAFAVGYRKSLAKGGGGDADGEGADDAVALAAGIAAAGKAWFGDGSPGGPEGERPGLAEVFAGSPPWIATETEEVCEEFVAFARAVWDPVLDAVSAGDA